MRSKFQVWREQYPVSPGELQVKDMNEMKQTIRELPESSRPYEKCLQWGPSVLSDSELLAVILRSGVQGCNSLVLANQILSLTKDTSYPGLLGLLHMSGSDEGERNRESQGRPAEMYRGAFQADGVCCCQTKTFF